jgi:predicted Zn-dependent peptidase
MKFSPGQMTLIRDNLLRELDRNSVDNGYLLGEISRRYAEGGSTGVAVDTLRASIAALTAESIQQAAQTYLNPANYVKVTLVPETK